MFALNHDVDISSKPIKRRCRRFQKKDKIEYEFRIKSVTIGDKTRSYDDEGRLHRENGPAVVNGGDQEWYHHGKLHRDGGPAEIKPSSSKREAWYQNGRLHREDGPAFTQTGVEMWYQNGVLHRIDGPAIISNGTSTSNGTSRKEWWIDGKRCQ